MVCNKLKLNHEKSKPNYHKGEWIVRNEVFNKSERENQICRLFRSRCLYLSVFNPQFLKMFMVSELWLMWTSCVTNLCNPIRFIFLFWLTVTPYIGHNVVVYLLNPPHALEPTFRGCRSVVSLTCITNPQSTKLKF